MPTPASQTVLTVDLGERSYPILIGRALAAETRVRVEAFRATGRRCALVADAGLASAQGAFLDAAFGPLPRLVLPAGETTKSAARLEEIWEFLAAQPLDRTGVLFAAGGGVVGDLAGFAAATYLRGIACVLLPSTLLAMVDSAVGGKTAINLRAGKNLAGAFHQPAGVLADLDLLATLPPREFAAGLAEIIKYGLLGDSALFSLLERSEPLHPAHPLLAGVVETCCRLKAAIVAADERETAPGGGRALLNLGHTFAHAIEAVAGYGEYLHGEAVALGLILAARLSARLGCFAETDTHRIVALVRRCRLPTALHRPLPLDSLLAAMARDKKVRHGRLRLVVLEAIGQAATRADVPADLLPEIWATAAPGAERT